MYGNIIAAVSTGSINYKLQSIKDEVFKYEVYRNYWSNGAGSSEN